MGRLVKILLWSVGGFATLFVLATVALYLFFDPNDFRDDISKSVKSQTGRDLTIEGDISLEIFPWLAVEVGKSSLGNAPGFGDEPMASFESASFSVRLLPAILRQEVVVGSASIESLRLNLILLPALVVGILLGRRMIHLVRQRMFEILLYVFSLIAGVRMLFF